MGQVIAFWKLLLYPVREKKTYAKSVVPAMRGSFIGFEKEV